MRCYNRYRLEDTSTAVTVRFVVVSILCSVVTFLFLGVGVVVVVAFFSSSSILVSSLFVSDCSQSPPVSFRRPFAPIITRVFLDDIIQKKKTKKRASD